jgi:hypothetical protein
MTTHAAHELVLASAGYVASSGKPDAKSIARMVESKHPECADAIRSPGFRPIGHGSPALSPGAEAPGQLRRRKGMTTADVRGCDVPGSWS